MKSIYRTQENYTDTTAGEALTRPRTGEIWQTRRLADGRRYTALVIAYGGGIYLGLPVQAGRPHTPRQTACGPSHYVICWPIPMTREDFLPGGYCRKMPRAYVDALAAECRRWVR